MSSRFENELLVHSIKRYVYGCWNHVAYAALVTTLTAGCLFSRVAKNEVGRGLIRLGRGLIRQDMSSRPGKVFRLVLSTLFEPL